MDDFDMEMPCRIGMLGNKPAIGRLPRMSSFLDGCTFMIFERFCIRTLELLCIRLGTENRILQEYGYDYLRKKCTWSKLASAPTKNDLCRIYELRSLLTLPSPHLT
jgi:hypothetical protein